jgi:hypothetical protein
MTTHDIHAPLILDRQFLEFLFDEYVAISHRYGLKKVS